MANIISPSISIPSSTTSTDSSTTSGLSVADLGGPSAASAAAAVKKTGDSSQVQDVYGAATSGVRGNVLSTQPPTPTDTTSVGATSLRSAQSKLSYLSEGTSAGSQALSLAAENPTASLDIGSTASKAVATAGSASTTSASSASASSDSSGNYNETDSTASSSNAAETTSATAQATKWVDNIDKKKCHHSTTGYKAVGNDISKQTGLSSSVSLQASTLMQKPNTQDYQQQIGTALAVLAQEKKEGSSSYDADKATITKALQTLTDNADTRASGSNTTQSVKTFNAALSSLSGVVTAHLGTDPSGGAPNESSFDPSTAVNINSWA